MKMKKWSRYLPVLAAVWVLAAAGCSSPEAKKTEPAGAPAAGTQTAGEETKKADATPDTGTQTEGAENAAGEARGLEPEEWENADLSGTSIVLILPSLKSEFFISIKDDFTKQMEGKGAKVTSTSYNFDSAKEIECMENAIISKPDVIAAMLFDNAADTAIKNARKAGIKVILSGVEAAEYDYLLVADNYDIGRKIAEMAADFVNDTHGGSAQIGVITSTTSLDMTKRSNGITENLKKLLPGSEIVMEQSVTNGGATAITENLLQQYPDVKVVCAFGDSQAIEAMEVFKAAGKADDGVAMFGCDCTKQGLELIAAGEPFRGTVDMGNVAWQMVEYTTRCLLGDPSLEAVDVSPNTKVTADNVKEYLNR